MMGNTKSIFKSKTNWGILIAVVPTVLRLIGLPIPPVVDEAIVVAIGGILAAYGRYTATQRLTIK